MQTCLYSTIVHMCFRTLSHYEEAANGFRNSLNTMMLLHALQRMFRNLWNIRCRKYNIFENKGGGQPKSLSHNVVLNLFTLADLSAVSFYVERGHLTPSTSKSSNIVYNPQGIFMRLVSVRLLHKFKSQILRQRVR